MNKKLKAPFPYMGGKSRVAKVVWARFGEVKNYVEPFCGSAAMLLASPRIHRFELINDLDGFVVNFWRAVQADPEAVARWADWPCSEIDMHARHGWLLNRKERLLWSLEDPDFFDAKIAGWWVWGASISISQFCAGNGPWRSDGAHFGKAEGGFKRNVPRAGAPGVGDSGNGVAVPGLDIRGVIAELSERMRHVKIINGHWIRALGNTFIGTVPSASPRNLPTAIFLDPPYLESDMDYAAGGVGTSLSQEVADWCRERGSDSRLRIALCGHEGEHDLEEHGWTVYAWKRNGMAKKAAAKARQDKERIWFSPHCEPETAQLELVK